MTTDGAAVPKKRSEAAVDPDEPDENAYEDHWYRMLKARSQRDPREPEEKTETATETEAEDG